MLCQIWRTWNIDISTMNPPKYLDILGPTHPVYEIRHFWSFRLWNLASSLFLRETSKQSKGDVEVHCLSKIFVCTVLVVSWTFPPDNMQSFISSCETLVFSLTFIFEVILMNGYLLVYTYLYLLVYTNLLSSIVKQAMFCLCKSRSNLFLEPTSTKQLE